MTHINEETLDRYLHEELPAAERQRVVEHLEHCAECRETVSVQKIFTAELQQLVSTKTSEDFVSNVMKEIRADAAKADRNPKKAFSIFDYLPDLSSFYAPQLAAISAALLLLFVQLSQSSIPTVSTVTESTYSEAMLGEELTTYGYDDRNFYLSAVLGVEGLIQEEVS